MAWGSSPRHGRRRPTVARVSVWFNRFRIGVWPDYFEGVQFSRDPEALDQYFRQMTPTIGTIDFDVYSDAYAALFDKTGPAVFVTHSQGGPVGWQMLQHQGDCLLRAGRRRSVSRRARSRRGQNSDTLQEDGRRRGADGDLHGIHQNPDSGVLRRQPARDGRSSRNLRMDTPPPPDAPLGRHVEQAGR